MTAHTTQISPEEHLRSILARIPLQPEIEVPLPAAHGTTLARDVFAQHSLPLWDNSAMDGYAVRSADLVAAGASGVLRIVGEVAAGSSDDPPLGAGETVRIMTGAPVPTAADTVVPVERTRPAAGSGTDAGSAGAGNTGAWAEHAVEIVDAPAPGANIRRAGEDTPAGTLIAETGQPLNAARIAALAAAGADRVIVRRAPRVAVIATGSELQPPGAPLRRGQIPESNSLLISGLLAECGIPATVVTVSRDDADSLRSRFAALAEDADVIVTTGGVGPGRHDIVRIAVEADPGVHAVRVRVKPGQPQCAGLLESGPFLFALPGNPVSAAVSFELFVRPALLHAQGRSRIERRRIPARAETSWRGSPGRLQVLPVSLTRAAGEIRARPVVNPRGVSHAVGGFAGVDGYALVDPATGDVQAGDPVDVIEVGAW